MSSPCLMLVLVVCSLPWCATVRSLGWACTVRIPKHLPYTWWLKMALQPMQVNWERINVWNQSPFTLMLQVLWWISCKWNNELLLGWAWVSLRETQIVPRMCSLSVYMYIIYTYIQHIFHNSLEQWWGLPHHTVATESDFMCRCHLYFSYHVEHMVCWTSM